LRDRGVTAAPGDVAIVGAGICGLSLAFNLHRRGIACTVYEPAPEVREFGVGITLLPMPCAYSPRSA
jgi:2-polyprenyl-6-methoxyphenol hydroxylase-like FAD-dependent oxidoreductase